MPADHVIRVSQNAFITIEPPDRAITPDAALKLTMFIGGSGMILNPGATAARELIAALAEELGIRLEEHCDGANEPHPGHLCFGVGEQS